MSEDDMLKCLIAFVLGFLVSRMMRGGNGLSVGGEIEENRPIIECEKNHDCYLRINDVCTNNVCTDKYNIEKYDECITNLKGMTELQKTYICDNFQESLNWSD
jgi:hypothetical protein